MTLRIAMWSGPRNISTAMMRSWENRADCSVVDEPFYAYYLNKTKSPHPYFDEVLAAQSSDYKEVTKQLTGDKVCTPIQYQKHMTHHMLAGESLEWTRQLTHCFLIRAPEQVVNSYTNSRGVCTVEDIGIIRQAELYRAVSAITGQNIPVIDSNDVLKQPKRILSELCTQLNISFSEQMLKWPSGTRVSDGVWAPHWYHSVQQSTGFGSYVEKQISLNESQKAVVEEVTPYYRSLYEKRLGQ